MAMISKILYSAIALLTIDALLEMAFIATTVSWVHRTAGGYFMVNYNGGQFSLNGKPLELELNQGHAANGAAGTIYVVIGFGGLVALYLRSRQTKRTGSIQGFTSFFYNFWLVMTVLSAIYTFASFIYVFVVTYQYDKQSINLNVASQLHNQPYPNNAPYPDQTWAPQGWFAAILRLPLADDSVRSDIATHLKIMQGWQWNLIPMFILNFVVTGLAFVERMQLRQRENKAIGASRLEAAQRQKTGSPYS